MLTYRVREEYNKTSPEKYVVRRNTKPKSTGIQRWGRTGQDTKLKITKKKEHVLRSCRELQQKTVAQTKEHEEDGKHSGIKKDKEEKQESKHKSKKIVPKAFILSTFPSLLRTNPSRGPCHTIYMPSSSCSRRQRYQSHVMYNMHSKNQYQHQVVRQNALVVQTRSLVLFLRLVCRNRREM